MSFQARPATECKRRGDGVGKYAQPKQKEEEGGSNERELKANIATLQDTARQVEDLLHRHKYAGRDSSVSCYEKLNELMEKADFMVEESEELLQVWGSQPAGASLRKFSREKLKAAFEAVKQRLEDLGQRVAQVEKSPQPQAHEAGLLNLCEQEQEEESALLVEQSRRIDQRGDQRLAGITRIQSQVADVAEIMSDIAGMVFEQGQSLDTMEQHTEKSADDTRAGVEELKKARQKQNSSRSLAMKALIFAVLICAAIYLVFGPHKHEDPFAQVTSVGSVETTAAVSSASGVPGLRARR